MYNVITIPAALTIAPSIDLTIINTAGEIQNIIPPTEEHHELSFLLKQDYILFVSGGNISLPWSPVSMGPGQIVKLFYNPVDNMYYVIRGLAS